MVVAISDSRIDPAPTLDSITAKENSGSVEIVLATADSDPVPLPEDAQPLRRHLSLPGANLPRLKEGALRAARGEVVAILDPSAVAGERWVSEVLAAFDDPTVSAVGGAVVPTPDADTASRALYLFEYSAFNPPFASGPTTGDLPGNNVAYRRLELLEKCADVLAEEGFNKPFCHERLREAGGRLILRPTMRVRHRIAGRRSDMVRSRFHYGRCFGATRRRRAGLGRKLLYLLGSPAVPLVLVLRHLSRCRAHPANRKLLAGGGALALAEICLAWGLGEWLGAWFGAGASCRELR